MTQASKPFQISTKHLARRHRREWLFRLLGLSMVLISCGILLALIAMLAWNALPGLRQTELTLQSDATPQLQKHEAPRDVLLTMLRRELSAPNDAIATRELLSLVSLAAPTEIKAQVAHADQVAPQGAITYHLIAADMVDRWKKIPASDRTAMRDQLHLSDRQLGWVEQLDHKQLLSTGFNWRFFTGGDSREPELASFGGAIVGSLWLLLVCLGVSFPLAVCTAIYLEEFKPSGRWVDFIEVNINNLAAVPSIVFGLLGLALFLNFFGMPRSAPIVGGLTLALMILPTIIIATRAALKAVPPSIRDAARGLGASDLQVVVHHSLPLALPGIMTGTILGLARAIGETAPLLMIGMVAFIVDVPHSMHDPATVMPVQIYLWANNPEVSFLEKTSAGILVLLGILAVLNAAAIWLRKRFEVRW